MKSNDAHSTSDFELYGFYRFKENAKIIPCVWDSKTKMINDIYMNLPDTLNTERVYNVHKFKNKHYIESLVYFVQHKDLRAMLFHGYDSYVLVNFNIYKITNAYKEVLKVGKVATVPNGMFIPVGYERQELLEPSVVTPFAQVYAKNGMICLNGKLIKYDTTGFTQLNNDKELYSKLLRTNYKAIIKKGESYGFI